MNSLETIFIMLYGILAAIWFGRSIFECKKKKNPYGITYFFRLYGAFVWADGVIFGGFWVIVSLIVLLLQDFELFLLILALFWFFRSAGETLYWFLQQFSTLNKNPPERFFFYKLFKDESIWFVHQIYWQCLTVLTAVAAIYATKLWLT